MGYLWSVEMKKHVVAKKWICDAIWETLSRLWYVNGQLVSGGDDKQVLKKDFFTLLLKRSPNKGELAKEDNNLNSESVQLEVFRRCHANVVNLLTKHLNDTLSFYPTPFVVGSERKCKL